MAREILRATGRPTGARAMALDRPCAPENARLAAAVAQLGPLRVSDMTIRTDFLHLTCPPPRHAVAEHLHPFLEVTYVVSGGMDYFRQDRRIPVCRGEIFVMPPDTPHAWINRGRPSVLLGFMLSVAPAAERPDSLAFRMAEAAAEAGYRLRPDADLRTAFESLRAEVRSERPYGPDVAASHARVVLLLVFRQLSESLGLKPAAGQSAAGSRGEQLHLQARAFIEANLAYGVSLADVARHLGVTGRHLNRIFSEREGVAVGEAIAAARLEKARALLRSDPGMPVKTVAALCGFNDASYFCRFFRQRIGRTPGEDTRADG
jgi:AraC-like DNA-binding protein/mannose-6-phosphate isomerase-like protein (cupin superfamily)